MYYKVKWCICPFINKNTMDYSDVYNVQLNTQKLDICSLTRENWERKVGRNREI